MADDKQEVVDEVVDETVEAEEEESKDTETKVDPKPKAKGPDRTEQVERLKRQAAEAKAERDKAIKERDEALAKASTAEDIQKLKAEWETETLRMEVLQEQGIPISARKKLSGTTRKDIEAEIEEMKSWVGGNGKADAPSEEKDDSAEDKKKDQIRRPPQKQEKASKPVSEMTPQERQVYFSNKMDEEFSATKK